eukprot:Selendium_serpulae@DN2655_c0_g1_i1.p1
MIMWQVKEAHGTEGIGAGEPVKCNDVVRFEASSRRNLHAHIHKSPISENHEVSAFGEGDGEGDGGDNYKVICQKSDSKVWMRGQPISLIHVDTNGRLMATKKYKFTNNNCPRCPIVGHLEVAVSRRSELNENEHFWLATGGMSLSHTDPVFDGEGEDPDVGQDRPSPTDDYESSPDFDAFFDEL